MRILENNESDSWLTIEGYHPKPTETPDAFMNWIGPGYFTTLGVPILAGRDFTDKDTQTQQHGDKPDDTVPRVVIVNEKFAKQFFGSAGNAIGRHAGFGIDPGTKTDMEIIGVVKDIKYTSLRDEVPLQMFEPYLANNFVSGMTVYARTAMHARSVFLGGALESSRTGCECCRSTACAAWTSRSQTRCLIERLIASLSAVFGFLATLLAVIGLYGVMAYTVARRTREIGIRMALGAFQGDVIWMVMREVLVLVSVGIGTWSGWRVRCFVEIRPRRNYTELPGHDPVTIALAGLVWRPWLARRAIFQHCAPAGSTPCGRCGTNRYRRTRAS